MQKRHLSFIGLLAALSVITGVMLSSITFVGRVGMNMFYKQYNFLKIWWQGSLLVFAIWMLVFFAHYFMQKRISKASFLAGNLISLMVSIGGLYFTYCDFRNDFSHRLMGERFHIGAYLFWLGWIGISIFYLAQKSSRQLLATGKAD
jgi:hypothetical protein